MQRPCCQRLRRGFTLLEVMISLAILAVALVAISDLNGGAVQMHAYARRATQATLLARGKMLDLEELLHKDGFSDFDDEKHGTFDEEGAPEFSWRAEILKPDIQIDPSQLLSMLTGSANSGSGSSNSSSSGGAGASGPGGTLAGLFGGGGLGGGAGGAAGGAAAAAAGPFAGLIQGQAKTFVETLKKSVREVRLTVSWQNGKQPLSISASQEIVILPESVGKAGQTPGLQPVAQPGQQGPTGQFTSPILGVKPPGPPTGDGDSR